MRRVALAAIGGIVLLMKMSAKDGGEEPAAADATMVELAKELRTHVTVLAEQIGPRYVNRGDSLARAEAYLTERLQKFGYSTERQPFATYGKEVANVIAERRGTESSGAGIVVVGAHYDTVPTTPGANDNATGVAAMLALARRFAGHQPTRTLRFVAFTNEEPPFFRTRLMGSHVYARMCRQRQEKIVGMLALETMGYYRDEDGSQRYPPMVGWFYPSRGNFIALVGNLGSRGWVRRVARSFRRHSDFPLETGAWPGWLPGIGWSDHWSFWEAGYPAAMVTDTALFRYPHYHLPEDTVDKIDFVRLARVVAGLEKALLDLAGGESQGGRYGNPAADLPTLHAGVARPGTRCSTRS